MKNGSKNINNKRLYFAEAAKLRNERFNMQMKLLLLVIPVRALYGDFCREAVAWTTAHLIRWRFCVVKITFYFVRCIYSAFQPVFHRIKGFFRQFS